MASVPIVKSANQRLARASGVVFLHRFDQPIVAGAANNIHATRDYSAPGLVSSNVFQGTGVGVMPSNMGMVARFNALNNDRLQGDVRSRIRFSSTDRFTVVAYINPNVTRSGGQTDYRIIDVGDGVANGGQWNFGLIYNIAGLNTTLPSFQMGDVYPTNYLWARGGTDIPNGTPIVVIVTYDGTGVASGVAFYTDSITAQTTTAVNNTLATGPSYGTGAYNTIGLYNTLSGGRFNGDMGFVAVINRVITIDERQRYIARDFRDLFSVPPDSSEESVPGGPQTYNKSCASTWAFAQSLDSGSYIVREIIGSTDLTAGGGRQTVVTAAGVIWHVYKDGNQVKACYSSDSGVTWTHTTVPINQPACLSMCIGHGGQPVIATFRTQRLYVFRWDGSSWIQLYATGSGYVYTDTQSMQIVYAGSTYHVLYLDYRTSQSYIKSIRTSNNFSTTTFSEILHDGSTAPTNAANNRRLAATVDDSGNVHLVISIYNSVSGHTLRYYKYVSSWTFIDTLATHGTGANLAEYASGISLAWKNSKIHVAFRVKGSTYSSNAQIRYIRYGTSVEIDQAVHDEVGNDQGAPSLSLNGVLPQICWDSAGLGLGVARARRSGAGTWSYQTISDESFTNVQTIHGPNYGLSYGRGVAGTAFATEEWFQSNDALLGTGAQLESTWQFSQVLSTMNRVMANTWAFTQSLDGVRSPTLRNTWIFTQRLNTTRPANLANTWNFDRSVLNGATGTWIFQTWFFAQSLSGIKTPNKLLAHTWSFTSVLSQAKAAVLESTWNLGGALSNNIYRQKAVANTWNFSQALGLHFSLRKALANGWAFISRLLGMQADEGCEPNFTPEKPLPASEDDVLHVFLMGPLPDLTYSVQLKRPEYGNSRRQSLQVKVNRTRAGNLRVHANQPTYEPQTMTFESLSKLKLEQVRNFLRATKGRKVYYLDENERMWEGYITSSDVDLAVEARDRGGTFQMDFEGRLV